MKDPFKPEREMLSEDAALRIKAEYDARFDAYVAKGGGDPDEYARILVDTLFLLWESTLPIIAALVRKNSKVVTAV